ncbi:glycosyltransferase [Sphingomonas sp.]|uniref:glycosyltransferase n=1 Tax=Sphingomonas sp. TaxID=28214 RepID=UPI001EBBFDD8|nr:glycosyltransferase [Sphingomonas sp.]MBX3593746.1 glycosyltransferase [Sphingomonas sp.]
MRIVDVNEYYSPTGGGVRTYLDRKMRIMAELGHELIVIAPFDEDRIEDRPDGGRIFWVKSPPLVVDRNYWLFNNPGAVTRLLDELDPDVVETSSPWRPAWFIGAWQGRALKVFFAHNDNIGAYPQRWLAPFASAERIERMFGWYTRYMNRFLERYDAFVTNGPALAKRYRRRGTHVDAAMPLGIDTARFSPDLRDEGLRASMLAQLDLPPEGHLLIGLGRHHREKRWPVVIDAVEKAGADMPVGLMLLGDGMQRAQLERQIAGNRHIRLYRPVYDRERFTRILASADALIHGSDQEPFGLVASEALASGLPLIVPNDGGCAEVADPLFAETYQGGDSRSAAAAIRRLFAREPAILRAAARHAAGQVLSDHDHAAALVDLYSEMLADRAGGVARRQRA